MKLPSPLKLKQAADFLGVQFVGNPNAEITGINEIHKVVPGDVTFVDVEKYYNKALYSEATFIIINKEVECPEGKALLLADDPFAAYNALVMKYQKKPRFYTSDFASGENLSIGEGTIIHPGAVIANDVKIGKNCIIYPNTVIYPDCILGDNVIIQANCTIGGDAYYFKNYKTHFTKMETCGRVVIADDVEIGANCTIDRGVSGDTIIGKGTKFDCHIHIGHGVVVGERCLFAGQVGVGGKTIIGNEVMLWGQVGVTKDITIGDRAVVLAKSGVSKSLKGDTAYFGSPAAETKKMYKQLAAMRKLPEIVQKLG